MHLIQEGGPTFMIPLMIVLLIIIGLLIAFLIGRAPGKTMSYVKHFGTVGLAWGLIGSILGLIGALDAIEASGGAAPALIAGGLKITLLSALFGTIVFFASRLSILIMTLRS